MLVTSELTLDETTRQQLEELDNVRVTIWNVHVDGEPPKGFFLL